MQNVNFIPSMSRAAFDRVRVRILPDGRMAAKDAARYIGVEEGTLSNWRYLGQGPEWVRVGGKIFYFQSTLDEYIAGPEAA